MHWWQALALGIIEGVTEYLPISSTGHLILANWLLGLDESEQMKAAADSFAIVVQVGAILAVFGLYRRRVQNMVLGLVGRHEQGRRLLVNLVLAFLPAAVLGPLLSDAIRRHLFHPWPVVGALFVGAWLMLAVTYSRRLSRGEHHGRDIDQVPWKAAVLIGFGQCIAMWPGTSRSMMTIVTALLLGLRPRAAAEFSFLLGLGTLTAATGYELMDHGGQMFAQIEMGQFLLGMVAATVSAALSVRWFVAVLVRRGLAPFAWYRLALAAVLAGCILAGWITVPRVL